jgi:hypothetical protein
MRLQLPCLKKNWLLLTKVLRVNYLHTSEPLFRMQELVKDFLNVHVRAAEHTKVYLWWKKEVQFLHNSKCCMSSLISTSGILISFHCSCECSIIYQPSIYSYFLKGESICIWYLTSYICCSFIP